MTREKPIINLTVSPEELSAMKLVLVGAAPFDEHIRKVAGRGLKVRPKAWGILWNCEGVLDDKGRTIQIAAFDWEATR